MFTFLDFQSQVYSVKESLDRNSIHLRSHVRKITLEIHLAEKKLKKINFSLQRKSNSRSQMRTLRRSRNYFQRTIRNFETERAAILSQYEVLQNLCENLCSTSR